MKGWYFLYGFTSDTNTNGRNWWRENELFLMSNVSDQPLCLPARGPYVRSCSLLEGVSAQPGLPWRRGPPRGPPGPLQGVSCEGEGGSGGFPPGQRVNDHAQFVEMPTPIMSCSLNFTWSRCSRSLITALKTQRHTAKIAWGGSRGGLELSQWIGFQSWDQVGRVEFANYELGKDAGRPSQERYGTWAVDFVEVRRLEFHHFCLASCLITFQVLASMRKTEFFLQEAILRK